MKKHFTHFLILLLPMAACHQERPTDARPTLPACTCIFFRPGHEYLLSNIEVVDEETNTSRKAMDTWKEFKGDFGLSFDLLNKKSIEINGNFIIPYLDPKGIQYFRVFRLDQKGEKKDYEKFVAEYCIQYDLNKDLATCDIAPDRMDSFRTKTEQLATLYLRAKPPANTNQPGRKTHVTQGKAHEEPSSAMHKVRIIYPEGIGSPTVDIRPRPVRADPGLISCEVWVQPGEYTANLNSEGSSWTAHFSHQSGVVAGIQFTQN